MPRTTPFSCGASPTCVMNRISGKSSSLMKPSSLSSVRFTTSGVEMDCVEFGKGEPVASGSTAPSLPQTISGLGNTSSKGRAGNVHVGASPEPLQVPTSQVVNEGQSQSSSQLQPTPLVAESSQVLSKY